MLLPHIPRPLPRSLCTLLRTLGVLDRISDQRGGHLPVMPEANQVGEGAAWALALGLFEPVLSRPHPRCSGGWPTGGFHGGPVASKRCRGRTAGPGFHLCSRPVRPVPAGARRVAPAPPAQTVVQPSARRITLPRSETCLHRKLLLGIFYRVGSLFPLVIISGKFPACISLDFFPPIHLLLRFLSACWRITLLCGQRLGAAVVCVPWLRGLSFL